jgi:SnoaL-like domain
MLAGAPRGLHVGGPPMIEEIESDRARTQQNLIFIERGTGMQRHSFYDDELRCTPDGWRIANRRCRFLTTEGLADRPNEPQ